jgi:hemerythrin-like metal-binding protein
MAFLFWHDRYRLGNAEIDAQHRKLFELVNHFDDVIKMGMAEELGRVLDDLITLTVAHFEFEENLFESLGFPQASSHKKVHEDLIKQAKDMRTKMKRGGHVSSVAIARFLADWLTNHIIREDMEYKPYLKP